MPKRAPQDIQGSSSQPNIPPLKDCWRPCVDAAPARSSYHSARARCWRPRNRLEFSSSAKPLARASTLREFRGMPRAERVYATGWAWTKIGFTMSPRLRSFRWAIATRGVGRVETCHRVVNARVCGSNSCWQSIPRIELILLIGLYAQRHFLGGRRKRIVDGNSKGVARVCTGISPAAASFSA